MGKGIKLSILTLLTLIFPKSVSAHAFGQDYTLALPLWLYYYGGGAAIIASFILVGLYLNETRKDLRIPEVEIKKLKFLLNPKLKNVLKAISLIIFLITIFAGLFGTQDPTLSLPPLMLWIYLLLGMAYFSALFGSIFPLINPFLYVSKILLKLIGHNEIMQNFPARFFYLPALIVYFILILLELVFPFFGVSPLILSLLFIFYTIIYFLGSLIFGLKVWSSQADFFNVFFTLLSKISPFEAREGRIYLRPPFFGLLEIKVTNIFLLIFIMFMLSSTAVDSFRTSTTWALFYLSFINPIVSNLGEFGFKISQIGLIMISPFTFLLLYFIALALMQFLVRTKYSLKELMFMFAPSLIPIALAYNIAHYYTLLLTTGQSIINIISDPFGWGWNLFNTLDYKTNLNVIAAENVWHIQVAAIIIGHIAAVYLSHLIALYIYPTHRKAVFSQLPMLLLMVIYTITGLWLLSQPSYF
jgi:hypothetical protein